MSETGIQSVVRRTVEKNRFGLTATLKLGSWTTVLLAALSYHAGKPTHTAVWASISVVTHLTLKHPVFNETV